jgi:Holliday junction resolvasome RuvABC DNA-binding subunit
MNKEEGITALRELGFSSFEIDEFIRVEKLRRKAEGNRRKREDAAKIIRNMSL